MDLCCMSALTSKTITTLYDYCSFTCHLQISGKAMRRIRGSQKEKYTAEAKHNKNTKFKHHRTAFREKNFSVALTRI